MRTSRICAALGIIFLAQFVAAQSLPGTAVPSDSDIRAILADRIDKQHQSVGIVVGIIDPSGRKVISYGHLAKDDKRPLDGNTVFEIGSVTKVFTALLLSDMVQKGEVALTDPVSKFLPATVKMPERGGRQITLQDLAMHISGLPRMPSNFAPKDSDNPYADYSVDQLYEFLSTYKLTRDIGSQYEYSNLGGGVLGHVLTRRAGTDYATLVQSRICGPLGMNSTRIDLTPEMKLRLATGHNSSLHSVSNWDLPTLAGAGALRSTANDLLTFLAANLGYTKSPLAPAMSAMLTQHRPTGAQGEIALGWHILMHDGRQMIWHNGGTGGYRSFIGYDPTIRVGVVALSNTSTDAGLDDIGWRLLNPPKEHKQIAVNPKVYDGYIGRYELPSPFILTVTREDNHLFTQVTGKPRFEVFPETEKDYFTKEFDSLISFETDSQGRANSLVVHQGGMEVHAKRIE